MPKLGAFIVVGGIVLSTIAAAHAAPQAPAQKVTPVSPAPMNPAVLNLQQKIEVESIPVPSKCSESVKARVKLTNKSGQPWTGYVYFGGPPMTTTPVTLAATGDPGAMKIVDVASGSFDCKKPLGTPAIRVWKQGSETSPIFLKILKPKTINAELGFNAPAPNETKVWLRRVTLAGTCGGSVTATATLQVFGLTPNQEADVKLSFGSATKGLKVRVSPNMPTQATLVLPDPLNPTPFTLDCQAANGIASFDYALLTGLTKGGTLDTQEVTFEP